MKNFRFALILTISLFFSISSAFANNITIPDKMGSGIGWHGTQEDDEVEPGMQTGQIWDLEGFFLNGSKLTMVGGYNFQNGQLYDGYTYTSGDIFIDTTGDVIYGQNAGPAGGEAQVSNVWGYDYAIRLDFVEREYTVYTINGASKLTTGYYTGHNLESNPWKYSSDATDTDVYTGLIYETGILDGQTSGKYGTALSGGTHNAITIDLSSFLPAGTTTFTSHFTMECGNDNLMGRATVPEPATFMLLGLGLAGLSLARRKFKK